MGPPHRSSFLVNSPSIDPIMMHAFSVVTSYPKLHIEVGVLDSYLVAVIIIIVVYIFVIDHSLEIGHEVFVLIFPKIVHSFLDYLGYCS